MNKEHKAGTLKDKILSNMEGKDSKGGNQTTGSEQIEEEKTSVSDSPTELAPEPVKEETTKLASSHKQKLKVAKNNQDTTNEKL